MAEVTAFRNNALPYPVYAQTWTVTFPLLDADGDPISPSSPDSERSLNGDTFGDCTNEAVEIPTSSGSCYLILTAAEMTADIVTVQVKSTGAKTTIITLYPRKLVVLHSGTAAGSNDTGDITLDSGASAINDFYNGCLCVATIDSVVEARIINDYVGSTKVAEISPAWVQAQPDSNDTFVIYDTDARTFRQAEVQSWVGTAPAAYNTNRGTAGTALPDAVAGASTGVLISGSNAGTTTLGALTVTGVTTHTGNVVLSDGLTISVPSTANRAGLAVSGNGTGAGIIATGGATGNGIRATGGATSGNGIDAAASAGTGYGGRFNGANAGAGLLVQGGATGNGMEAVGGATSGSGARITAATLGHGLVCIGLGNGDNESHGIRADGGGTGTNDGIKATAGTGGVPIRGDLTGNITGNLSGSVGSVTGAVGSVTGAVGSVTGAVGSVAAGGITASSIAADAIGASELAADAVAEIADAVWDELTADHQTADTTGKALTDAGGAGTPPTAAAIADAVWDETMVGHTTDSTFGQRVAQGPKVLRNT